MQEELGLDVYMTEFRMHDPALGRFWQIDLVDKEDQSPYAWAMNNPILYMDILGLDTLKSNAPDFNWNKVKPGDVVDGASVLNEAVVEGNPDKPADATKEYVPLLMLREGDKVMGHRDGISGLEDVFGPRTYGPYDVDAEGKIRGLTPIIGMPNEWLSPGGPAKLSTNGVRLTQKLASEAQMAERGIIIIRNLKVGKELVRRYGGNAANWVKKSSSSFTKNNKTFEVHWYENVVTGQRVEFKTKLIGGW